MKRRTKYALIAMAAALVLLASVIAVYAYLSDRGEMENKFTVGNNSIEIDEDFDPPPELKEGDNPFIKRVRVSNTGNVPCYVRVFFDFSDSVVKENAKISSDDAAKDNFDTLQWYSYEEYKEHLPEGWVYISVLDDPLLGGYFYYTEPLPVGEKTPYLFQAVNAVFDEADHPVTDFEIIIIADSVQVADKDGREFEGDDAYRAAFTEFLSGEGAKA